MMCPFCGLLTDVPHESQKGCIDALRREILLVRGVLQSVHSVEVPRPEEVPVVTVEEDSEEEPMF